jgi:hypothetical protein
MKVIGAGMLGAWSGYMVPGFDKQRLQQLPGAAIRHVLQDPRVHVLNIGMRLKEEIDANVKLVSGDTAYTPEDRDVLAEFSAQLYDTEAIKKLRVEGAYAADIWAAAKEGNLEAVKQALAAGTAVNAREPQSGGTPLTVSTVFGQTAVAALLIQKGADVAIAGNDGNTALHLAAFFGRQDVVELLLQHGASVQVKNARGETPIDIVSADWSPALEQGYTAIASAIGLEIDLSRIKQTRPKIAKLLREHGPK